MEGYEWGATIIACAWIAGNAVEAWVERAYPDRDEFEEEGTGTMKEVRVSIDDLETALVSNRAKHEAEYKEALVGYRVKMERNCELMLADARAQQDVVSRIEMKPREHLDEYDRAIAMCEMSEDEFVTLSAQEFDQFCRDNWAWTRDFKTSAAYYMDSK